MAGVRDPLLQLDQFTLQTEQLAEITNALTVAFGGVARGFRIVVLDLEFHFLVKAVDDLLTDPAHQFFVFVQVDHLWAGMGFRAFKCRHPS